MYLWLKISDKFHRRGEENMNGLDEYQKRLASGENATDIMNDMEKEFDISMVNDECYNLKNADVMELYRKIANSRNL